MISEGTPIYYIEYLDHARSENIKRLESKPFILWCCGTIAKESEAYIAVICSGTKDHLPSSQPTYEIVLKSAIIKKELIFTVKTLKSCDKFQL